MQEGAKLIFSFHFDFGHGTSFVAEFRALLMGLRICDILHYLPAIVELDNKTIVDLIQSRKQPPWFALQWWAEVIRLLEKFASTVTHSYREGNRFADAMANFGADSGSNRVILTDTLLPTQARGHLRMEKLGFPNVRITSS